MGDVDKADRCEDIAVVVWNGERHLCVQEGGWKGVTVGGEVLLALSTDRCLVAWLVLRCELDLDLDLVWILVRNLIQTSRL